MAKRRRTTSKQRVASRRNLIVARRKRFAIAGGVLAAGAILGTAAFAADRKYNHMTVYHATSHHRAKKIHVEGYKTLHKKRAYSNHSGVGPMHESGRVFVSTTQKAIKSYGPGVLQGRIRKSSFRKYAIQDVHPKSIEGERFGFKSRNSNHYHIEVANLKKAGLKLKYTKDARKSAKKRIYRRYDEGDSRFYYE